MRTYVCEIYDHKYGTHHCKGIDFEECAGTAYEDCMREMNINPYFADMDRFEFFCTEENIDFQWDMTPEHYQMLKNPPSEWTPDDYLGAVFFGNCKLEFIWSHEGDFVYCNMFVKGIPGYDFLSDGTPYADYEGFACKFESDLPKRRTFDAFARKIEHDIVEVLNEYHQLIEDALKPTNPDAWYPYDGHKPITIARRA